MPHLLGYHNLVTGEDFIKSDFYTPKQINEIPDPEAGNTTKPPTSIPSPFAAMDLTRTAFRRLAEKDELRGDKIDQKLVSLCWDVGEVFFNSSTLGKDLQIINWDRKEDLKKLLDSPETTGHRILGDTIKMFLEQDAETYNFSQLDHLYMLKYKYQIIGGTSSSTLFFSTLNPIEQERDLHIKLGNDYILFDDKYCPLYLRDNDFQTFIYTLKKNIPGFTRKFREVNDYLEKNLEILKSKNPTLYNSIQELQVESYDDYDDLPLSEETSGNYVTVLGVPLRRKKKKEDGISDFKIKTDKYKSKAPLILKRGFGGKTRLGKVMTYFDCPYDKDIDSQIAHYHQEVDINERVLPGMTGQKYPYLLVSDLLEDKIIKLVYKINADKYFDGNLKIKSNDYCFMLPIKNEFFKYFDTDYLVEKVFPDGKPAFEMEERGNGGVKVTLRVEVKEGYIELDRLYMPPNGSQGSEPDLDRNHGGMKEILTGVNVFPFVKSTIPNIKNQYRVQTVSISYNFDNIINRLQFFKNSSQDVIVPTDIQERSKIKKEGYGTNVYILEDGFDYIQIIHDKVKGIIIPKFKLHGSGTKAYRFSVDFGTTNTHIEYNTNSSSENPNFAVPPKPFDIISSEIQVGVLHDVDFIQDNTSGGRYFLEKSLIREFMPLMIGENLDYSFPQRTILSEPQSLNYKGSTYALADFNIPFIYEKEPIDPQNVISTNLKWSNFIQDGKDSKRVEAYLENLLLLIRAKVLLNDGDLSKTELIWFYPTSMLPSRRNDLERMWSDLAKKHLSEKVKPIRISESIAPFYYYKRKLGKSAGTYPVVSVDIGGGTTDFVVFINDKPKFISSFRFAANSVFGDAYKIGSERNGFVAKYKPVMRDLLEANGLIDLVGVFDDIVNRDKSEDIVAFLMSLEGNKRLKNLPISFQNKLRADQNLKLIILLFYSAVVYHIAKFMNQFDLPQPNNLIFSGNGSKIINLLDLSNDLESLSRLTSIIFHKVYETTEISDIEINQYKAPKEITCKGGLLFNEKDKINIESIRKVVIGTKQDLEHIPQYSEIDEAILNSIVEEAQSFIEMFFSIHNDYSFTDYFSVNGSILKEGKDKLMNKVELKEFLVQGINYKKRELNDDEDLTIEETLFFYPLVGIMNELAYHLSQK